MKRRDHHIPLDRLTALAFVARAPRDIIAESSGRNSSDARHSTDGSAGKSSDTSSDKYALAHVSDCETCAERLASLTASSDALREQAFAAADEVFDQAMLDAQRTRILDRLATMGQAARVLSFPRQTRDFALPGSGSSRRWISVAAAAGLIIGLLAGQVLHFIPASRSTSGDAVVAMAPERSGGPTLVPVAASAPLLSDDELMEEVETAIGLRRAQSLRALDGLTPTAADLLALGR